MDSSLLHLIPVYHESVPLDFFFIHCFRLSFSSPISLSLTHCMSLFLALSVSLSVPSLFLKLSLSPFHTHIYTVNLSLAHTVNLSHTYTHCISLFHTYTHCISLSFSHTVSIYLCIYLSLSLFLSLSLPRPGSANHLAPNDSSPDDIADLELGRQMVTFSGTFQKEILYPGMLLKKGIRWNIKFNSSNFLNTNNYRYLITIFVIFHIQWVVSTV